jgi:GH24 family phage-related lysozyme (muramidase)
MSTYSKYIEYAKVAIGELKQLETLKKSVKGAKLAQAIKEKGLKKITKSHVDSVLHGLGKSSDYSPLSDSQKQIAKELQDIGEKVALTHKDKAISGILEKVSIDKLKLGMMHEMLMQKNDLKAVITVISNLKKDPDYYRISELTHKQWMDGQSTGIGNPDHPINTDVRDSVGKLTSENAEMAQSDITKIIDYSEKLQSMFDVNDNLEDWVKAKLNHACDYVATVRDYLKFYRDEKEAGTPDNHINEKWSNTYKKSIDCSNAKGFSQKAHCAARRKRQAGGKTQSKSVKESYKEALQELLKEQNSSMAMGALKQLNSDAKELETMLQPTTQLEDWVKSKLNLAGEYLDDVYHHLDHFGTEGRQFDENYYADRQREREQRMLRFSSTTPREKKYWFTPSGTVAEAGLSHEDWIKQNDPSLVGTTLVGTYDNAIKKGYIRAVVQHGFLMLSNLENSDFSMNGNTSQNVPAVKSIVLDAIKNFIAEKDIKITASGRGGNIIKDLSIDDPNLEEDLKRTLATAALAAATAFGGSSLQAKTKASTSPTTITRTVSLKEPSSNTSFTDYLKYVENGNKVGYDVKKKLWFPHKSVEGGSDTIAYGHKIQSGEDFSGGLTDSQAEDLLKKDIEKAKIQINKELKGTKLTPKQEEMFIDFVFNMGTLKKFPKFVQATLKNDESGINTEYKRFAGGKELKGRNMAFARRYLS